MARRKEQKVRAEVRALKVQREKLGKNLRARKDHQRDINRHITSLLESIKKVDGRISRLEGVREDLIVTDHAVLRYLERVMGVNLEEVRMELLPLVVKKLIMTIGCDGVFPVDNSHRVRVKDHAVVTVLDFEDRDSK